VLFTRHPSDALSPYTTLFRSLLDAGATAVGDADQRHARAQGEVHDLGDLLAVHLAQAPAEHGEVLGVDADLAPVDGAVPDDDAVARDLALVEAEARGAVGGVRVELDERARVEQLGDALAGGLLAARVLLVLRGGLRDVHGGGAARGQVLELRGGAVLGDGVVGHPTRL